MAEFDEKDKPTLAIEKTPQGQFVVETPDVSAPAVQHNLFGYWGTWLGNPYERYGYLVSSMHVPINTKLEMMKDEVLALCIAFCGATLLKAKREIHCVDENKRRFFEALFKAFEQDFILKANVGIALGSLGLVKKWRFAVPEPVAVDDPPVWKGSATPYIITGFDQLYPETCNPRFDEKGRQFEGMDTPDGPVDVFHSLWLTFRQELAFGAYSGVGRLEQCYKQWWLKNFATDLYVVALQKEANRVVEVRYPPGKDVKTGKDNRTVALDVGDSVRSGATIAVPSDTYITVGLDGEERQSSIEKWALQFLEGAGKFDNFHQIDDHHDRKMSLGYFLPPQALLEVTGGQLGSITSAEKLTDIAEALLMQDAADIDRHVNEYVFPAIARANFPIDSPRVVLETLGLEADNRAALLEVIKALVGQSEDATYFDMRGAFERMGFPLKTEEQLKKEKAAKEKAAQEQAAKEQAAQEQAAKEQAAQRKEQAEPQTTPQTTGAQPANAPGQEPPQETKAGTVKAEVDEEGHVITAGRPLRPWADDTDVPLADEDAIAAVAWWRDFAPAGARGLLEAASDEELAASNEESDWEGQLCPYHDCAWQCEFSQAGWYKCPHCNRLFYARVSDSDYEDFSCYTEKDKYAQKYPQPENIPFAGDRGPSWVTPERDEPDEYHVQYPEGVGNA